MLKWLFHRADDTGVTYYRKHLPVKHCAKQLREDIKFTFSSVITHHYDVYTFSRSLDPKILPLIFDLKQAGKKIVWDLDDDLLDLKRQTDRDVQEAFLSIRCLRLCLGLADYITVSTPQLGAVVNLPQKTTVLPNLIDLDDFPIQDTNWIGNSKNILYAGSPSHNTDILLIRDLFEQTQSEYHWIFYGICAKWLTKKATYIPWSRVYEYPRVCALCCPVYALAPLEICRFNDSKSPIKVWESATFGGTVVSSNFGPYEGHPSAVVPAGEVFTLEHLREADEHREACMENAYNNSWQHGEDKKQIWHNFFAGVVYDCLYGNGNHIIQLPRKVAQ